MLISWLMDLSSSVIAFSIIHTYISLTPAVLHLLCVLASLHYLPSRSIFQYMMVKGNRTGWSDIQQATVLNITPRGP